MDPLHAARDRAARFDTDPKNRAKILEIRRMTEENRRMTRERGRALIAEIQRLLADARAEPDPCPAVIEAYTSVLAEAEALQDRLDN